MSEPKVVIVVTAAGLVMIVSSGGSRLAVNTFIIPYSFVLTFIVHPRL